MTAILIKNKEQIDGIRKSSKLAALTLLHLDQFIKPRVSTNLLNNEAEKFIRDHGAIPAPLNYMGFPKSICTSLNEVICHGIPSEKDILKEGDILNVDVTTILDGYYGDTSKMYKVGRVTKAQQCLLDATLGALNVGIQEIRPGNHFGNIGYAIQRYIKRFGYSIVYQFVGHGVGIDFHEEPNILHIARKDSGPEMLPGMIFTVEPMLNTGLPNAVISEADGWTARTVDGGLSAQYEHTCLVTENGCEILTS